MADIYIDIDKIGATQKLLEQIRDILRNELNNVRVAVSALLEPDGGLWFDQGSPMMQTTWEGSLAKLQEGVSNIDSFVKGYNDIAGGLQDLNVTLSAPPEEE